MIPFRKNIANWRSMKPEYLMPNLHTHVEILDISLTIIVIEGHCEVEISNNDFRKCTNSKLTCF